jgi:hypothetical protein
MKNNIVNLSMAALLAFSLTAKAEESTVDCGAESKKVSKAVSATPEDVLKIVAAEVSAAPSCACEIVKAAIKASKADKDLVVSIVTAAAEAAPDEAPAIIACAIEQSPEAARAIADKFASGKGVVATEPSGKEPVQSSGKEPAPSGKGTGPVDGGDGYDIWDFGFFNSGIGNIYTTPPSSGLSPGGRSGTGSGTGTGSGSTNETPIPG